MADKVLICSENNRNSKDQDEECKKNVQMSHSDGYNRLIIAIPDIKKFEKFLKTDFKNCVLLNIHVSLLEEIIRMAHNEGKRVFLHMDLINGLTNDRYGAEYAIQKLGADGLMSTNPRVCKRAGELGALSVQRIFLLDTHSLEKGLETLKKTEPDFVEVLPGKACELLPVLLERCPNRYMCGGLIMNVDDIEKCFEMGACGVTISKLDVAEEYVCRGTEK